MTTSLFYRVQISKLLSVAQTQHSEHIHCACCEICTEQYDKKSKNSNNFLTDNRTPSLNDDQFPTKYFVQTDTDLVIYLKLITWEVMPIYQ